MDESATVMYIPASTLPLQTLRVYLLSPAQEALSRSVVSPMALTRRVGTPHTWAFFRKQLIVCSRCLHGQAKLEVIVCFTCLHSQCKLGVIVCFTCLHSQCKLGVIVCYTCMHSQSKLGVIICYTCLHSQSKLGVIVCFSFYKVKPKEG